MSRGAAALRALGRALAALGVAVVFVGALAVGVVLHLDHPAARKVAIAQTQAALAKLFDGQIVVDRVDKLTLAGLDGGAAHVVAPDGTVVVRAFGVRARADVVGIVRSVLSGNGPIVIPIREVHVDYAEVVLDAASNGSLELRAAFARRLPLPPKNPNPRGIDLAIDPFTVRHAWVHGQVPGTPPSDLDVDDVAGSVVFRAGALKVDVGRFTVQTRSAPRGLDATGTGEAHLGYPARAGTGVAVEGAFDGMVGGIGATLRAAVDGPRVDVSLDVPRAPADKVRALFPDAPAQAELGVRIDAHGELPRLDVDALATLGAGTLHVAGPITVEGARHATLTWDAAALDLRAFGDKLPESNLQGKGTVDVAIATDASLAGTFTADVGAGTVRTNAVPPATLRGTFAKDASGVRAHAEGLVHEAGAPADVTFDIAPDGGDASATGWLIDATARATVPRLAAVPRIAGLTGVRGAANVRATGKLHTKTGALDATVTADVSGFARGTTTVGQAHVTAHATGKLPSPAIATTLKGDDLVLGSLHFPHAEATTHGTLTDQHVEASLKGEGTPDVQGTADVSLGAKTTVRDANLALRRDREEVSVHVPTLRFGDGDLHIEDADIRGLGAPARATVDLRASSTQIRAHSRGVSLARLGRLLHLEDDSLDGLVSFDVDLELKEGGARGSVSATLSRATVRGRAATAEVHATADGRRWLADAKAMLAGVGDVELSTKDLELGAQGPMHAAAWQAAAGTVGVRASVDLAQAASLAPKGTLAFAPAGMLDVSGALSRGGGTAHAVSISLAGSTRGLDVTTPAYHVAGVEARLGGTYDGSVGATAAVLVLTDAAGEIVRLDVQSDAIPYRELWAATDRRARLEVTPFVAKLAVPMRAVDRLPAGLALKGAHGTVELTAQLGGSIAAPELQIAASVRDFASKGTGKSGWLSADLGARYDGATAHASASVRTTKALILTGTVDANAKVAALLSPPAGELPWDASGKIELLDFPLSRVALLADHDVRGKVTGEIAVTDFHKDARASAKLTSTSLQIGNVAFPKAQLAATVDDKELRGTARIEQSVASTAQNILQQASMSAGFGELAGSVGLKWGGALAPTVDTSRPMEATLATKRLRAAAFMPFVDAYLGELDGLVDANAIVALVPGAAAPTVVGSASLEDGIVQVASTGTELHGASARLTIGADGTVRLANVVAHGITGTVRAAASARLEGVTLVSGAADVVVAEGEAVPVDLRGMQLGDVWGEAHAKGVASADRKTMNVTVDIPKLHAQLPLVSSHGVKDRESLKNVHVGFYSPGRFTKLALDAQDLVEEAAPAPTRALVATVNLGPEVEVKRGTSLAATIEGSPVITVTDKPVVTGQVRLPTGTLLVQGKKFEIEKGTVSFVGTDPSNPLVVVTAGWTAADGTRVYADFIGPLKTGKVTLRSEPSRPKDEILGLILFGSADQSTGSYGGDAQADTGTRAGGAAGTFATQGLSEGIDELTGLQIATKIDTSNAASPRPEVEVQLARTISLQIAFVLGTPFPNPDKTFATIGWRFADRWRLETTFGDAGSSFADVVWQLRY